MLDAETVLEKIRSIKNIHKYFKISEVGEISYSDYSRSMLTIESHEKADENVLITAGIHGNEPAGVLATIELLKILTSKPVNKGYAIIPYVNPWGYDNHSRRNRINRDINRDFRDPETQEALVIARYLSGKEFDLVLDLHEDPYDSKGYYLYYLSNGKALFEKAEKVIHQIRTLGFPVENRMRIFPFQTRNGIVTVPYWGSYIARIVDQLAFCNYCRTMGISKDIIVTETPTFIPLERRVELQLLSIETLTE